MDWRDSEWWTCGLFAVIHRQPRNNKDALHLLIKAVSLSHLQLTVRKLGFSETDQFIVIVNSSRMSAIALAYAYVESHSQERADQQMWAKNVDEIEMHY